jgi:mercuric ion transport protein
MSDLSARPAAEDRPTGGAGPVLLTLGGLAAAFGVASCCALPLLLTTLGLGTAWLGGVALLAAPHRPLLLTAAALCLLGGAALLWWQRRAAAVCAPGAVCARPAVRGATAVGLLLGLVLLTLGYAYA